ncbi:MAG TPA: hypothetical protein VIK74_02925 [Parasegetibacter sp.]
MGKLLLLVLGVYLLYKFIFRFVIPVYMTTKQVRKQFEDIQQQFQQQGGFGQNQSRGQSGTSGWSGSGTGFSGSGTAGSGSAGSGSSSSGSRRQPIGEYIDFEEVK